MMNRNYCEVGHIDLNFRKKSSGWVEGVCPFCNKDRKHVLQISPDGGWVHCFRCGWNGSMSQFEKAINTKVEFAFSGKYEPPKLDEYEIDEGVAVTKSKQAYQYLKSRGAEEYAILNKWRCTPDKIIIPIYQYGTCVGKVDRNYKGLLRYRFSDGFKSSLLLFNYDLAKHYNILILNEGVFDVISTSKALPFCGVVGLFGKSISCHNTERLRAINPDEVVLMLDSPSKDKEIKKAVVDISLKLCGMPVSVATLKNGDPNESSVKEVQEAFFTRKKFGF